MSEGGEGLPALMRVTTAQERGQGVAAVATATSKTNRRRLADPARRDDRQLPPPRRGRQSRKPKADKTPLPNYKTKSSKGHTVTFERPRKAATTHRAGRRRAAPGGGGGGTVAMTVLKNKKLTSATREAGVRPTGRGAI